MNDSNRKNMKQIVAGVQRGPEAKTYWTRVGTAFENRDGSWNLLLDFTPTDTSITTLQLRDIDRDQQPNASDADAQDVEPPSESTKTRGKRRRVA